MSRPAGPRVHSAWRQHAAPSAYPAGGAAFVVHRAYAHVMVETRRTGRTEHEIVELAPSHCGNGHRLGPLQVLVGFDEHPSGVGRARVWTCRACGHQTWCDPLG